MVRGAEEWPWSSYRTTAGLCGALSWLYTDWLLGMFSEVGDRQEASRRYCPFVAQGKGQPGPWEHLKNQVFLGSDGFVEEMQCKLSPDAKLQDVPAVQKRRVRRPLDHYENKYGDRDLAIEKAYLDGGYGMKEIGEYFGLHYSRISQILSGRNNSKIKTIVDPEIRTIV